jgi:hypothetical protein
MRAHEFLIEKQVDDEKYIGPINQLLSRPNVNLFVQPNMKGYEKNKPIDFYPYPDQQVSSLKDTIKGKLLDPKNGEIKEFPVSKVYKTDILKNLLQNKPEDNLQVNRGELSEGYHAVAAFARLIKRPLENIDIMDILNIIQILENGEKLSLKRNEVQSKSHDLFELTVKLKPPSWKLFKDPNTAELFGYVMDSIISDANHETSRFAERFATNEIYDVARIVGDGVSGESERKTDVSFENESEKKFLGYSLKVRNTQVHQVASGPSGSTPEQRFEIISKGLFAVDGRFPLANIEGAKPDFLKAKTPVKMQQIAFKAAEKSLNQNLKTIATEKTFLKNLVGALKYWVSRDDPNVKVKKFEDKGTTILDPNKVDSLLKNNQLNLVARYSESYSDKAQAIIPMLYIYDAITNKNLVIIRTRYDKKTNDPTLYVKSIIEQGPVWKNLTFDKFISNTPDPEQYPPETAVDTPNPPVAPIKQSVVKTAPAQQQLGKPMGADNKMTPDQITK